MGRASIYYVDTIEPVSGWRYRLEFQGAWPYDLQSSGAQQPAVTGVPAFMGDPGVGSIYIRMPDTAITSLAVGVAEYDGVPLGWPSPPSLKLGFDLTALNTFYTETGDTSNIATRLLSPVWPDGGIFYISDPFAVDPDTPYPFDLFNLVRYTTDAGDKDLAVTAFEAVFIGTQNPFPSITVKASRTPERVTCDVEFTHIIKACLEAITPDIFVAAFRSDHAGTGYPNNTPKATGVMYDYLFSDGVYRYARAYAKYKDDDGNYEKARLYHIRHLAETMRGLVEQAYYNFTRIFSTTTVDVGFYSKNTNHPHYDAAYNTHTPLSVYEFFEQDYTEANVRGASLLGSILPENNIYFVGYIWSSTVNTDVGTDPYADAIGGFLSPHDDYAIHTFTNMWDFMKRWADGTLCKVQFDVAARDTMKIYFNPLKQSITTDTARRYLRTRNFRRGGGDAPDAEIEIGGQRMSGAVATWVGAGNDDETNITVKVVGSRADADGAFEIMFHNIPGVGDAANRYRMSKHTGDKGYNPDISGPHVIGASTGFRSRTLYYISTPLLSASEIAIRVHDTIGVDLGDGYVIDGEITPLPTTSASQGLIASEFDEQWWYAFVATMKGVQLNSGMGYATAYRATETFSDVGQSEIRTEVDLDFAYLMDIGDRYTFVDDAGAYAGGNIFLDTASYLTPIPGRPYLTKCEPNYVTHTAKITLLSPPT